MLEHDGDICRCLNFVEIEFLVYLSAKIVLNNLLHTMKMYHLFLNTIISMSLLLVSCEDKSEQININQKCSVQTVEGYTDSVIGEWRLIRKDLIFSPTGPTDIDFSCDNVIYVFSKDGMVSISSDVEAHSTYANGKYSFEFETTSIPVFTLTIGKIAWPCQVFASKMILDRSPTDGGRLTFFRTKK